ncbi:glycosyltransferase [Acidipila sp. EB88]|nr:glycosyltransferase [Acidipila sp. EB88]
MFAVIVLYKQKPQDSPSYRSLLDAHAANQSSGMQLSVLLVDNTPRASSDMAADMELLADLPAWVEYLPCPENLGLANAYNRALERALRKGAEWLLTLDQDTELPLDFLSRLGAIIELVRSTPRVAAIVPQVSAGAVKLSRITFCLAPCPAGLLTATGECRCTLFLRSTPHRSCGWMRWRRWADTIPTSGSTIVMPACSATSRCWVNRSSSLVTSACSMSSP